MPDHDDRYLESPHFCFRFPQRNRRFLLHDEGERGLFFNNEKGAGLNNVFGDEYLIYHDHELFNASLIQRVH